MSFEGNLRPGSTCIQHQTENGIDRLKHHKVDARKIAEYGFRFQTSLTIWTISTNHSKSRLYQRGAALVKITNKITGTKDFKKVFRVGYSTVCEQVDKGLQANRAKHKNAWKRDDKLIQKDSELAETIARPNSAWHRPGDRHNATDNNWKLYEVWKCQATGMLLWSGAFRTLFRSF